jgi:hypothetical protein
MSALSIQPTYPIFTDIDGQPLEAGYVWIGTANLDPQTNPINVYWDAALTILAPQPIRTLAGYPSNNGTPARLYVNSDYSIRVMNKNGSTVYSAPAATERYSGVVVKVDAADITFTQNGAGAVASNVRNKLVIEVDVMDFIPPAEHDAIRDGTSTYDCTADFVAAFNYIQSNGLANEFSGEWPTNKRWVLTGPPGVYNFSDSFVTPVNARPDYVNFDIVFNGSQFKALPGYNTANSLIHMKAAYDYVIQGIGFYGFKGTWVIFNDSSLTQNFGGKTIYKDLRFSQCEYGIRHELESVVAVIEQCLTDENIIKFLWVWRADQVAIRDCFFSWKQQGLTQDSSFISFGVDDYSPTGEAAFPGNGTYNPGRLNITNSMFIPVGIGVTPVHTAWIGLYGGFVVIKGCHFGPESTNRPSTVMNFAKPALYTDITSLVDSGIIIEDSSCVSSYDIVYCKTHYPNVVKMNNIRWNTLYYENAGNHITQLLGGVSAVLNSIPLESYKEHFCFSFENIYPSYKAKRPYDSRLIFPAYVTEIGPYVKQAESFSGGTNLFFDLNNRDNTHPSAMYPGIYEVTLKSRIDYNSGTYDVDITMQNVLQIKVENNVMSIVNTQTIAPSFFQTPSLAASFLVNGTPMSTVDLAVYDNEVDTIVVRLLYTTNVGTNSWYVPASTVKIKNVF